MRITGGAHRGRVLHSPADDRVRPTADKTRLAIFNMLQARGAIVDHDTLDVFCGTGALGLEAVSRGARTACLIDSSAQSVALAQQNIDLLKLGGQVAVLQMDATKLPVRPARTHAAGLVFLDPPYRQDLVPVTLEALVTGGWIADRATVVVEVEKGCAVIWPPGFEIDAQKNYGQTDIYLLKFAREKDDCKNE